MTDRDPLQAALVAAREQLARLEAGDIDGYAEALPDYGIACARLDTGVPAQAMSQFAELLEIDARMALVLATAKESLRAQLAPMGRRRRFAATYFPESTPRHEPLAQA